MTLPILDLDAPKPGEGPQSGSTRTPYDESVGQFEWAKPDGVPVADHIARRFPSGGRGRPWKDTPDADWNDWRWQQRNRVTRMDDLEKVIDVTDDERTAFAKSDAMFHMGITPYYASLMDPEDPNDPIRLQSVPKLGELVFTPVDLEDPLAEERDMPVPGVTHRYPDRVLFYTTHNCPVYCRHCTRKRKVADPTSAAAKQQIEGGLKYIEEHTEIRDIVISGGDPLSLSDERLDYILGRLRAIPHVEIFRLGTRNLVTLPQRITDDFVKMLRKHHPVYVNTHYNHPRECTAEAFEACRRVADAGCVIGNQMVLLKGVNDDPATVKELNHKLLHDAGAALLHLPVRSLAGHQPLPHAHRDRPQDHRGAARPHLGASGAALRGRRAERRREDSADAGVRPQARGQEVDAAELRRGKHLRIRGAVIGRQHGAKLPAPAPQEVGRGRHEQVEQRGRDQAASDHQRHRDRGSPCPADGARRSRESARGPAVSAVMSMGVKRSSEPRMTSCSPKRSPSKSMRCR